MMILETWGDLQQAMTASTDWKRVVREKLRQYDVDGREEEVVWELLAGKTNKEIAETMYISDQTVKNHMTAIFRRLRVADRTQAILVVLGIIDPILEEQPRVGSPMQANGRRDYLN